MKIRRLKKGARKELYQEYLRTDHWKETRARIIARAGGKCEACGKAGPLEVHHLTYERLFNENDNDLLALCGKCHGLRHGYHEEDDMIDLNTRKTGERIVWLIDEAICLGRELGEEPRRYLGASLLGEECQRKLQYAFFNTRKDFPPDGRMLRIFMRGNWAEKMMENWLVDAGFNIGDAQKGFSQMDGQIQGHIDGIIKGGPADCGPYPRLWENKCLGAKYWRQLQKDGLKKACPRYYGQVQLYMAYMVLDANPACFTALNADTMEILALDVPFDQEEAQKLSDKAVTVIQACRAGEQLPRCARDPSWYACKICDWRTRCWEQ